GAPVAGAAELLADEDGGAEAEVEAAALELRRLEPEQRRPGRRVRPVAYRRRVDVELGGNRGERVPERAPELVAHRVGVRLLRHAVARRGSDDLEPDLRG